MVGHIATFVTATEKHITWNVAPARDGDSGSDWFPLPFGGLGAAHLKIVNNTIQLRLVQHNVIDTFQLMIKRGQSFEPLELKVAKESCNILFVELDDIERARRTQTSVMFKLVPEPENSDSDEGTNLLNAGISVRQSHVLGQMFDEQVFGDFTLIAEGKEIKVSKLILASRSDVFRTMFETDMSEKRTGQTEISDVTYDGLRALIKFIYSSKIEEADLFVDFLVAADKYNVKDARDAYLQTALKSITTDNVDAMMTLGYKYNLDQLVEKCFEVAKATEESKKVFKKLLARFVNASIEI